MEAEGDVSGQCVDLEGVFLDGFDDVLEEDL